MMNSQTKESLILGQKYAFATASLILGILSFVNLLGPRNRFWRLFSVGSRFAQPLSRYLRNIAYGPKLVWCLEPSS